MKKAPILAFALALVLGAATIIYACGKGDQASGTSSSSCANSAKTSQVSLNDKSSDVKVVTADARLKDDKATSSGCPVTSVGDDMKCASMCPSMKDGSTTSQSKATKIDDSVKRKTEKAKTVQTNSGSPVLAATKE
jgi:hypothetical protein